MTKQTTHLRSYPIEWPVFSVKNYRKDDEGWWNWCPKKRTRRNDVKDFLQSGNDDDIVNLGLNTVLNLNDETGNFRLSR